MTISEWIDFKYEYLVRYQEFKFFYKDVEINICYSEDSNKPFGVNVCKKVYSFKKNSFSSN